MSWTQVTTNSLGEVKVCHTSLTLKLAFQNHPLSSESTLNLPTHLLLPTQRTAASTTPTSPLTEMAHQRSSPLKRAESHKSHSVSRAQIRQPKKQAESVNSGSSGNLAPTRNHTVFHMLVPALMPLKSQQPLLTWLWPSPHHNQLDLQASNSNVAKELCSITLLLWRTKPSTNWPIKP